jgi:hypothetical protein
MLLSWRNAFRFPTSEAGAVTKLLWGGLWLLICPPLGWTLALGYRREVALRLVDGVEPVLPRWGWSWEALLNGFKAAGVVAVYFVPFLVCYWVFAIDNVAVAAAHWRQIVLFWVLIFCFLPLTMPGFLFAFPAWNAWMSFSHIEMAVLVAVFCITLFVVPAAFLQVSLHRRFACALRMDHALRLICSIPRAYIEAWAIALTATMIALVSGPLMPWGIVWSYLVIGFGFNNALATSDAAAVRERFRASRLVLVTT